MYFLLLLQQLMASGTHIVVKDLTSSLHIPLMLFIRGGIAALLFAVWILFNRKKVKRVEKKDILTFLLLGFINIPDNQFLFFIGVHMSTAPNAALAYALTPAFVLVIAIVFLKESSKLMKIAGIAVAIAGTVLILLERGIDFKSEYMEGNLILLLASFSWAIYTILGKNITIKYGAVFSTALSMILGFLMYVPIFLYLEKGVNLSAFSSLTSSNWLELLYLGIFSSCISYAIWYFALTKIEASKVAVFNNLQPIFTTALAMIFFSHQITVLFAIGGTLIIGGVYLAQRA
ncbi:MAG: DMT family transporter [Bacteroidota bacterium]|jgi:RarD protein